MSSPNNILIWEGCSVCAAGLAGDAFKCLHCGHIDDAGRVAATNLKARWFDQRIALYTPKAEVKEILLAMFSARLERDGCPSADPTVPGRTPGDCTVGVVGERNDRRSLA